MTQARRDDDRNEPAADEAALSERLQRLGERLSQPGAGRLSENERRQGTSSDSSALARGLQLASEFIAGILVGAAIGWLIDHFAGTSPWGLIVFLLLGFATGVLNLIRAARATGESSPRQPGRRD